MSNNPYDEGRYGGGPPASGADHAEWWRGYQDRLKGLQQPSPEGSEYGAGGDTEAFPLGNPPEAPYSAPGPGTGGGEGAGGPGTGGTGGTCLGILGAGCLLPFLAPLLPALLPLVPIAWLCLYPFSAAATWGAWCGSAWLAAQVFRGNLSEEAAVLQLVFPVLATLGVLVVSSRLDQRLARYPLYRVLRHLVRLLCFGGIAGIFYVAWTQGRLLDSPQYTFRALVRPEPATLVLMVMIGMHFFLWRSQSAQERWHGLLKALRLRG